MAKRLTAIDYAKQAARHHTTLCQLEVVANVATGSDIDSSAYRTGERIAALCRAEQQRQLQKYDAALARAASGVTAVDLPEPDCWAILTPNGSRLVPPAEAKGRKDAYRMFSEEQVRELLRTRGVNTSGEPSKENGNG